MTTKKATIWQNLAFMRVCPSASKSRCWTLIEEVVLGEPPRRPLQASQPRHSYDDECADLKDDPAQEQGTQDREEERNGAPIPWWLWTSAREPNVRASHRLGRPLLKVLYAHVPVLVYLNQMTLRPAGQH
jgi:hypothetical protein